MKEKDLMHVHPRDSGEAMEGTHIVGEELIQQEDELDSDTEKWEKVPKFMVGKPASAFPLIKIIRPKVYET